MELAQIFNVSRSTIQYRLYGGSYKPRREQRVRTAKGYSRHRGGWQARIKIDGRNIHLGLFKIEKEARAAYLAAKKKKALPGLIHRR